MVTLGLGFKIRIKMLTTVNAFGRFFFFHLSVVSAAVKCQSWEVQ